MPTFETPNPITAQVDVDAGCVRVVATDRDDTVVEIRPRDESRAADVRAAEQTRVYYREGTLSVTAGRRGLSFGHSGAVDIDIALPSRSCLRAVLGSAALRADGEFTECRTSSAGGDVAVQSVTGNAKADSASGDVTWQSATGSAAVSTASGSAMIGKLDGDLTFRSASGDVTVDRLRGNVKAQTSSGSVKVDAAVSGAIMARSASGDVQVGIAEGTAARLDVLTASGSVTNRLRSADGPADGDETLVVRVRTASGDVDIHRSLSATAR